MTKGRQRSLSFPGDHTEKRAARVLLYRHALAAPIQGHAVTLAGTEPEPEIALMRDYLRWPAHRAWFVDNSKRPEVLNALQRARKEWPTVNVRRINLRNIVPHLEVIGFANLDFMGTPLQEETADCIRLVAPRLLPGAIMGFTWMRGREFIEGRYSSKLLWKLGKGYRGNERRWAGVVNFVDSVSNKSLKLVDKCEYLSNHSPMSVGIFRKG